MKFRNPLFCVFFIMIFSSKISFTAPLTKPLQRGIITIKKFAQSIKETRVIQKVKSILPEGSQVKKIEELGKNTKGSTLEKELASKKQNPGTLKIAKSVLKAAAFTIGGVAVSLGNGCYAIQGDILVDPQLTSQLQQRSATLPLNTQSQEEAEKNLMRVKFKYRPWPNQIIPYDVSALPPPLATQVKEAMHTWEKKTGIRFIDKTKCRSVHDYLQFRSTDHSGYSALGYGDGERIISIPINSDHGLILHELGHAMGLIHEHNRPDRDSYIHIYYEHVRSAERYNFDKNEGITNLSYDYDSVMHYSSYTFSLDDKQVTLTKKDGSLIPENNQITKLDAQRVKAFYSSIEENTHTINNDCPLSTEAPNR